MHHSDAARSTARQQALGRGQQLGRGRLKPWVGQEVDLQVDEQQRRIQLYLVTRR
jgi:hypothetical protein